MYKNAQVRNSGKFFDSLIMRKENDAYAIADRIIDRVFNNPSINDKINYY